MKVVRCNVRVMVGTSRAGYKWTLGKFQWKQRQKIESLTASRNSETKERK